MFSYMYKNMAENTLKPTDKHKHTTTPTNPNPARGKHATPAGVLLAPWRYTRSQRNPDTTGSNRGSTHPKTTTSNSGNQPEPTNPASFNAGPSRYIHHRNPEKDSGL